MPAVTQLDALDVRLLQLIEEHPRVGVLELSRLAGVARATVSARLERMQNAGVITGYGPQLDLAAAGYPVQALATLEISQGRLDEVVELLTSLPGVIEAYATTGTGDVVCRLAAASNDELQLLLLELNRIDAIRRSTSVVILSIVVPPRTLPLLLDANRPISGRTPSFRAVTAPPHRSSRRS
jgi:DNA-binding Lrp family transcriptional regulator